MATQRKKTDTQEAISKFEEYRERALKVAKSADLKAGSGTVTNEPFVLGEEYGFKPEIKVEKPSFLGRVSVQRALESGDVIEMIRVIFGDNAVRVLVALDGEGDDAELVALGLVAAFFEHFYGLDLDQIGHGLAAGFTASRLL